MSASKFKLRSNPADFEILHCAIQNIATEMSITMERTSRSPIFSVARDFSTAIFDKGGNLVAVTGGIPLHICSGSLTPKAALKYFGDDIRPGDIILLNDPYTFDGNTHLPDWSLLLPVFREGKLWFWAFNRAHQADIGGGEPGGYNPAAPDCFAEGIRIPPVKIFEGGKPRKDVIDFILANVRFPDSQRGDLWAMIGSARIGERRLLDLLDTWGSETIEKFLLDIFEYTEVLMQDEIAKVPDGTYYGEDYTDGVRGSGPPATIRCALTVKGNSLLVDLSQSDPMLPRHLNCTFASAYGSVFVALMTSVGRNIKYYSEGCMKPVEVRTKPGTIVHAIYPAPHVMGNSTGCQIIGAVWDALAKVIPERTPAGWGGMAAFTFNGLDPRTNEGYASPDFLANASGAGAIWGTDGWHAGHVPGAAGGILYPDVETCESNFPAFWTRWELATDSGGAGRWRGGTGTESVFVLEAEEMRLGQEGDHFTTKVNPAIAGGGRPPYSRQLITRANGAKEEGGSAFYIVNRGDTVACYCQGGCGVGDPLDRDIKSVRQDVIDEIVSLDAARETYGVVINPDNFEVDETQTKKLRLEKKKARGD